MVASGHSRRPRCGSVRLRLRSRRCRWVGIPALLGMAAGQRLRGRIHEQAFRVCFLVSLLALGLHLALRTLL